VSAIDPRRIAAQAAPEGGDGHDVDCAELGARAALREARRRVQALPYQDAGGSLAQRAGGENMRHAVLELLGVNE
jgi:hypothetical protein